MLHIWNPKEPFFLRVYQIKVLIGIDDSMKNLYRSWNIFIAQKVLYSVKWFFKVRKPWLF